MRQLDPIVKLTSAAARLSDGMPSIASCNPPANPNP